MTLLIEIIVLIVLFTIMCTVLTNNCDKHLDWVALNYPPKVVEYLIKEGRINLPATMSRKDRIKKKLPIAICFVIILALIIHYVNGCETFLSGFGTCFLIWFVVDWYDALVLDCLWFCHSKKVRVSGTENMDKEYGDYMFHIKGSAFGMVMGLVVSAVVGLIVAMM